MAIAPVGFYRVVASVDPAEADAIARDPRWPAPTPQRRVEVALAADLLTLRFTDVRLAYEDPTDASRWTLLARFRGGPVVARGQWLTIRRLDAVEEPPVVEMARTRSLDRNLTVDELRAVRLAVEKDGDPSRLDGLADALEESPMSAALIRAKAVLERATRQATPEVARVSGARPGRAPRTTCASGCRRTSAGASLVGATDQAAETARRVLGLLEAASEDLGPDAVGVWARYEPTVAMMVDAGAWEEGLLAPLASGGRQPAAGLASNTAVMLAAAARGPETSLVARPRGLGPALVAARSGVPDEPSGSIEEAILARRQAARARAQVDRQNWVRWFNASAAAGLI